MSNILHSNKSILADMITFHIIYTFSYTRHFFLLVGYVKQGILSLKSIQQLDLKTASANITATMYRIGHEQNNANRILKAGVNPEIAILAFLTQIYCFSPSKKVFVPNKVIFAIFSINQHFIEIWYQNGFFDSFPFQKCILLYKSWYKL